MDLLVDRPSATNDVPELVKSKGLKVEKVILIADGEWFIKRKQSITKVNL